MYKTIRTKRFIHTPPQTTSGLDILPWKKTDFTYKSSFSNKGTEIQRKEGTHLWSQKVDGKTETKSPTSLARILSLLPLGRNIPLPLSPALWGLYSNSITNTEDI